MPNTDNFQCPVCGQATYVVTSLKKPEKGPRCPVCDTPYKEITRE